MNRNVDKINILNSQCFDTLQSRGYRETEK